MKFYDDWDAKRGRPDPTGQAFTSNETSSYGRAGLDEELTKLKLAREGERNNVLNEIAFNVFQLVDGGHVNEREAFEALDQVAQSKGLTRSEIAKTLRSARDGARRHPRRDMPDPRPTGPQHDPREFLLNASAYTASEDVPTAEEFWNSRGLHAHIRQFAQARMCSPWAVLGATLLRVAAVVPPNVVLPPIIGGRASLNTFVALVGRSGDGKDAAMACAEDAIDLRQEITIVGAGSGEGIPHLFAYRSKSNNVEMREKKSVILTAAEVDTLGALMRRQSSTLLPELRKAWTGSALGFAYADARKHLPIASHSYRLGLIVGVQPERASILLDDVDAGTPQRFIWLHVIDPDAPDELPELPIPQVPNFPVYRWSNAGYVEIDVCEEARSVIVQARRDRLRGKVEALDGHALLCRLKVAALLAILNGSSSVDYEFWQLAGTVMRISGGVRERVQGVVAKEIERQNVKRGEQEAQRHVISENRRDDAAMQRVQRTITRKLVDHGPELAASKLRRQIAARDRGFFDPSIAELTAAGKITLREEGMNRWYRLA